MDLFETLARIDIPRWLLSMAVAHTVASMLWGNHDRKMVLLLRGIACIGVAILLMLMEGIR